jgi:C4-dicarboxylate-specific signal transduction histidine kinase
MKPRWTVLGEAGLQFFGKMSAANAHEIKNALAIINENAGLLSDLVAMAKQGSPLSLGRLKRLAETISQQVARADEIAKSTNRFAHSVDKAHGPADLGQSLVLVKTMAMRFATKRHIDIEVMPITATITLRVAPFRLLHLLWMCLQCAMETTNAEKTIQIKTAKERNKTIVRYGPLSHLEASTIEVLSALDEMDALLQSLGGRIEADLGASELVLTFSAGRHINNQKK